MAKMKKIDIEEGKSHEVAELICLNCHSRAIHVYPVETLLKDLQCKCGATGLLIKTGQTLYTSPTDLCSKCKLCVENYCKMCITPVDDYCGYFSEVDNGNDK